VWLGKRSRSILLVAHVITGRFNVGAKFSKFATSFSSEDKNENLPRIITMPNPHPVETSIVDLLKDGGASQQAIQQLTPAASKLTKRHLLHLWLRQDEHSKKDMNIPPTASLAGEQQLTTKDITSILVAFENAYASSAGLAQAQGFFCNWSCCCCTPCCCCAAAVIKPVVRVS
jgi:hypothetical protein